MVSSEITWQGILIRFFIALLLVFATYNPSTYSYYHWVAGSLPVYTVFMIFVGVVLTIAWVIFLRATMRSLGFLGLILAAAFFGTLIWLITDWGLIPADNVTVVRYLVLIILAGVMATGLTWSHIRRRITGQADVDDV